MKIEELAKIVYPLVSILESTEAKRDVVESIIEKLYPDSGWGLFPKPPLVQIWEELLEISQYDEAFEDAADPVIDGYDGALENL